MSAQTLTINTRHFVLPPDTEIEELEHRIEEAARRGGAMIAIPGPPSETTALITPATTVFFDVTAPVTELLPDDGDQSLNYDFELPSTLDDWTY